MLGAGACQGRRGHGRREGGRVTVHTSAPLVRGVLDAGLPDGDTAGARHDGRPCRDGTGRARSLAARVSHAGLTAPKPKADDDRRPSRRAGPGRGRQRGGDGLSAGSAHHGRPAHDGDGRAGRMQDITTCPEDAPVTDGAVLGDRRQEDEGTGHETSSQGWHCLREGGRKAGDQRDGTDTWILGGMGLSDDMGTPCVTWPSVRRPVSYGTDRNKSPAKKPG